MTAGRLVLCGTPIGNLEDMTFRGVRTLREADAIACEDSRRTRKLLSAFDIEARDLVVLNDTNERRLAPEIVRRIRAGDAVALVSDAGMPGLSDPGYRLVSACVSAGLRVEAVPGPTSVVTALVLSGLPPARFVFEGFLPRKAGDRRRRVDELVGEQRTLVFFCSPHRVGDDLDALLHGLGDRPAALARELTKLHEEVRRGRLSELAAELRSAPPRGEMVLVVLGAVGEARPEVSADDLGRRARALMDEGVARKDALAEVARASGVPKRRVFDALIALRERDGGV